MGREPAPGGEWLGAALLLLASWFITANAAAQTTDPTRKANYGHYFAVNNLDTPADATMLCEQAGVRGVVWPLTWGQVETAPGVYDFSAYDQVLAAIAESHNP